MQIEPFQFFLETPFEFNEPTLEVAKQRYLKRTEHLTASAVCLDDFDSTLQTSGQLLINFQNQLLLLHPKEAIPSKQASPKNWRFISELSDGDVKSQLSQCCNSLRALLPGTKNNLTIEQYVLLDEDEKTHARCSIYHLNNSLHQLTFGITQGLRGYDESHHLLCETLIQQGASSIDSYAPVYQRCGFPGPLYVAKPKITIQSDAPVINTTIKLISSSLRVSRQNEAGVIADYDSEFLHDYRVNLRKVRSILSLFKGVFSDEETLTLKQNFSQIMGQTNRLRDLDVYLLDQEDLFALLPHRMHAGLQQMFDAFSAERKQQLQSVSKMLNSKSYKKNIESLCQKFESPEHIQDGPKASMESLPFATKLIWKRYSKVCQIARQIDADTPDEEVHELRIQCKKLRYLMEFFATLFPQKMIKELIRSLKKLQDNLGRFNDFSVQQESLQTFLSEYSKKHRHKNLIAMAESIGALMILLQQKQDKERAQVMQSFARFDSPEIRNRFSEIFHHGVNQ